MSDLDWKAQHAVDSEKALEHEMVAEVMAELRGNLGVDDDGLVAYGIRKVAYYAASVARAQALGFDPNLLRMTSDEASSVQMQLAAELVFNGVPVHLIEVSPDA